MTYTNELLDMVKDKYSLESDYKLAQKIGVSRSRLSKWRNELNSMDWDVAFKIADLLGMDDQKVVYGLLEDKYENPRLINALCEGRPA
ncbi:helix-turn-helix domain-containing protein [Photobacterium ganghwense]|uniref:helix-turn-helix domain-containing protein n=1 Tax=Photobacterium ganghwense TaxID=320778 RepID=UPI001C2CFD29|nr:helix-turn-helix domain-containing protein [Photobacterium ganghwense]MBV1843631.1 helix-turn-helix domain-containing protein [Photobacterium ganghwense]